MVPIKRIFCVLLALVFLLTAPGVVPVETEAVAVADDAALLSLALLFTTWAGVTFTQNDQAVTAMQNFLTTKAAAATTLTGLVTKTVLDGAKLLITGDVRTAFRDVLPEIKDFFQTESDEVVSASGGSLTGNFVVGSTISSFRNFSVWYDASSDVFPYFPVSNYIGSVLLISDASTDPFYLLVHSSGFTKYKSFSNGICSDYVESISFPGISALNFYTVQASTTGPIELYLGVLWEAGRSAKVLSSGGSPQVSLVYSTDSIPFHTSKEVNGSASLGALDAADLEESDKTLSIAPVTGVISNGVAGSTAAPGLSAEDLEKALANALAGTAVLPTTPGVTEPTATTPDENGETQIVTPDILSGMFSGLKGWLESLLTSILEAIQAIGEKIDAFGESIKSWWTETIADVKAWIEVKIQSIADWWTTFWADTIAAIKALGAAVTEFFTVTFPAWITDVKEWALSLPQTIIDAIIAALAAVFVPAAGYWDAKVAALQAKFPLFNSILTTGKGFSGFFSGLGSRPPVIYIDLGSSASWVLGGRTIFLDLTWYSNYKPTMDLIIAGFLWLLFAWRFFLRLPGLLRGEVGTIDRLDSYLDEKRKKNGG